MCPFDWQGTPEERIRALKAVCGALVDKVEYLEGGDGTVSAAYIRVSTFKQAKKGFSMAGQEEQSKQVAVRVRTSYLLWFMDAGKSGKEFDREKLDVILRLAQEGIVKKLISVDVDRIGRDCLELLAYAIHLSMVGVTIHTPQKDYDIKKLPDMVSLFLEGYRAQGENKRRTEAAIAGKAQSFKQKHWNKPAVPFGYTKAKNSWLEKNLIYESLIKDVHTSFLEKRSLEYTRRYINAKYKGLLTRPLTRNQIKSILSDPTYIGKPQHLGETVVDASLAYISEETFYATQKILSEFRAKRKSKRIKPLKQLVIKYTISALEFLDRLEFHHKGCGGVVVCNGPIKDEGIEQQIFRCRKCGRQFRVPTKTELERIQNCCSGKNDNSPNPPSDSANPLVPVTQSLLNKLKEKEKSRKKKKRKKAPFDRGDKFQQCHLDSDEYHV